MWCSFLSNYPCEKVEVAGIASRANGMWTSQVGRHVTDAVDGILDGKRFLIHDCHPLFTAEFQDILASVGVKCVKLPPRSPNLIVSDPVAAMSGTIRHRPRPGGMLNYYRAAA